MTLLAMALLLPVIFRVYISVSQTFHGPTNHLGTSSRYKCRFMGLEWSLRCSISDGLPGDADAAHWLHFEKQDNGCFLIVPILFHGIYTSNSLWTPLFLVSSHQTDYFCGSFTLSTFIESLWCARNYVRHWNSQMIFWIRSWACISVPLTWVVAFFSEGQVPVGCDMYFWHSPASFQLSALWTESRTCGRERSCPFQI